MSKPQSSTLPRELATGLALAALLVAATNHSVQGQAGAAKGEWREYPGDSYGTKYSPLDQITADNVQDLRLVWRWRSPDADIQRANPGMLALRTSRNEDTPLLVKGVMYHVTGLGQVAAIDPGNGQTRWVYDPQGWKLGRPNNGGFLERGMG